MTSGRGRRRCCRRWSTSGSGGATRRRRGSGGSPPTRASCTRSTRCSAGRRRSGCSACWSTPPGGRTGATRGGWSTRRANRTGGWRSRCWPRRSPTRRRARRCCAGRGCGWRGNPRRSPASCCGTSRRAASGGASAGRARTGKAERRGEGGERTASRNGLREAGWTSPASRTTRSPPGAMTTRQPRSSTPSAIPEPSSQATSRPSSASRSPPLGEDLLCVRVDPAAQGAAPSTVLPRCGVIAACNEAKEQRERVDSCGCRAASGDGGVAQLGRELVGGDREVEADADHRPVVLGSGLDQDAGELAAVELDVVRPLDLTAHLPGLRGRGREAPAPPPSRRRRGRRRAAAAGVRRAGAESPSRGAPCRGARSSCGLGVPRPSVCSSAVTTVPCGAPAAASSAGARVGRVRNAKVPMRHPKSRSAVPLPQYILGKGTAEALSGLIGRLRRRGGPRPGRRCRGAWPRRGHRGRRRAQRRW